MVSDTQKVLRAFHDTFDNTAGRTVLAELSRFCLEETDLFHLNERVEAYNLGRRSVIKEIRSTLNRKETEDVQENR